MKGIQSSKTMVFVVDRGDQLEWVEDRLLIQKSHLSSLPLKPLHFLVTCLFSTISVGIGTVSPKNYFITISQTHVLQNMSITNKRKTVLIAFQRQLLLLYSLPSILLNIVDIIL